MHSFLSFNKNFLKLRVECKSVPNISKITSIQASCFMANLPYVCHKKQRLQNRALIKSFLQTDCKMSLFCSLFSVSTLKTQKIYGKFPWYEIHSSHIEYRACTLYSSRLSVVILSIKLKWNKITFVPVCGWIWLRLWILVIPKCYILKSSCQGIKLLYRRMLHKISYMLLSATIVLN